jgi:putative ABC transport system permease protein
MKHADDIWRLIARKLAGEASPAELKELEDLLRNDPDKMYSAHLLSALWTAPDPEGGTSAEAASDRLLERLSWEAEHTPAPAPPVWSQQASVHDRRRRIPLRSLLHTQIKTTYRNLLRSKSFSLINISGLAVGMASAILLLIWIHNELTYDQFHTNRDRIYQVYNRAAIDGRFQCWGSTPQPLGPVLESDYPEVEAAARTNWVGSLLFNSGDNHLRAQGYLTDPSLLSIFSLPLLEGNAATALVKTHSIVLTPKLAKKLFGDTDPLGKTISVDSNIVFTVTGLLKELPSNTQFQFEYLLPWSYMKEVRWDNQDWGLNQVATYVLLKPDISERAADSLFAGITESHDNRIKNQLFVQPIRKWRLYSDFEDGKISETPINLIRMLATIAAFILLIACINYMNLSTARSIRRAKEVGIRKVMGAGKASLVWQFLGESLLIACVGGLIALGLAQANLGWFNHLIDERLTIPYENPRFWMAALAFVFITGLVAGSYPAFFLSSYQPIQVLKGTFKTAFALVTPRKILVVFQFSIAITLVICTIVIYRQIRYAQKRDAGYNQDNLVFVYMNGDIQKNYAPIREDLVNSGAITAVMRTNSPITDIWSVQDGYSWKGKPLDTRFFFTFFATDKDLVQTTGLKITSGRDINVESYPSDSSAVLLSEATVRVMGLTHPVGDTIHNGHRALHIVGVVKDFIPGSPYEPMRPMVIEAARKGFGALTFRLDASHPAEVDLDKIRSIFKKYNPDYPFEYKWVNDAYAEKFEGERHMGTLAALFSGLTVFISCLGLFALAAYMAESRIREIGIRKVLGASITHITALLSGGFLKLVLISFAIASPVAWWAMHAWLNNYAYRVELSWWLFALTGLFSFVLALLTVSYQAVTAALASPAESLRSE